jgi:ABC-type polysaccharide/polyol phosphate transport system ATPase subunit
VLSVADDAFREMCIAKLQQAADGGKTIMIVSHDLNLITRLCHRALLLKSGGIVMDDTVPCVMRSYGNGNSAPADAQVKFTSGRFFASQ